MEFLKFLSHFTNEILLVALSLLGFSFFILIIVWILNRKKFHQFTHRIPASVLKSYLDTIIQNSISLRSALSRGGGGDFTPVASILSAEFLPSGNVDVETGGLEDLRKKTAEIEGLRYQLKEKEGIIKQLETKLSQGGENSGGDSSFLKEQLSSLQTKNSELESQLRQMASNAGNSDMLQNLESVTKERDTLKKKLAEYEIIEDDLANLKKYQNENKELKERLSKYESGQISSSNNSGNSEENKNENNNENDNVAYLEPKQKQESREEDPMSMMPTADLGGSQESDTPNPKSEEELLDAFEKMLD